MANLQFSVRTLLAVVTLAAMGCAALDNASPVWAGVAFTATVALLLAAVVAAVCRRGTARAFWLGFAVLGWGYFWLAGGGTWGDPFDQYEPAMFFFPAGEPELATTRLLRWTYTKLYPKAPLPEARPGMGFMSVDDELGAAVAGPASTSGTVALVQPGDRDDSHTEVSEADYPPYESFLCVGESLWTLLFACFGGLLGRYFHAKESSDRPQPDA